MGDIVMPKNNVDDLVKLMGKHYKSLRRVKEGNREIRELQAIFKGQLLAHPEYVARKKK